MAHKFDLYYRIHLLIYFVTFYYLALLKVEVASSKSIIYTSGGLLISAAPLGVL
jgi:hypothetical protein